MIFDAFLIVSLALILNSYCGVKWIGFFINKYFTNFCDHSTAPTRFCLIYVPEISCKCMRSDSALVRAHGLCRSFREISQRLQGAVKLSQKLLISKKLSSSSKEIGFSIISYEKEFRVHRSLFILKRFVSTG